MEQDVLHPLPPDVLTEPTPAIPFRTAAEAFSNTAPPTDPPTVPPN